MCLIEVPQLGIHTYRPLGLHSFTSTLAVICEKYIVYLRRVSIKNICVTEKRFWVKGVNLSVQTMSYECARWTERLIKTKTYIATIDGQEYMPITGIVPTDRSSGWARQWWASQGGSPPGKGRVSTDVVTDTTLTKGCRLTLDPLAEGYKYPKWLAVL